MQATIPVIPVNYPIPLLGPRFWLLHAVLEAALWDSSGSEASKECLLHLHSALTYKEHPSLCWYLYLFLHLRYWI